MAEDTTTDPFSNIDNISPFLNSGQIGIQQYQPIPAPERFDINSLPGGKFTSNPTYGIKDANSGSTPNYPVKNAAQAATIGMDKGVALARQLEASLNGMEDKNNYAKLYAYDAGKNGAFKARYKAYGQETFDKVGFHPLIDNETWFNKNTTGWDDFKRMMTHSAWPLFSQGFMDPIKSYASFFGNGGDISGDTNGAASYEELSSIGYSTKGGIGGFTTNLFQSAAYSVGILVEGALEGALVGAAVGAAQGGLPAVPGAAIGGIAGFFKSLWRLPSSLAKMTASFGKMGANLARASKLSEAKNMFVNAGKSMGNFFNPLENTINAGMNYVFKNPDDLTALARSAKTAGALWHDAKNLNMALSEGRLEGGMAENRVYEKLYNDHYNLFGEAPDDATQQKMHEQAKEANLTNTIANGLLVFYSNKLVFPSLTQAKFLKGMPKAGFGSVVGQVGDEYQLVYTAGKEAAEGVYTAERISLANAVRGFVQPKIYGRVALNYFKKNLVEGLQEVSQDALASATEDYYTATYYDPTAKNFQYAMGTLKAGFGKQISSQGLETFLSGFAMGSILQAPSTIGKYMSVGYNKYYKNRDNYQEYIDGMESSANATVDALNTMNKNGKYFFDPRLGNYVNQVLIGKKLGEDDTRTKEEIKDDEFTAFQSAVMTSIRTGTFDLFLNNFAEYKQASPKDIEEAWNLEEGQGEKALESMDKAIKNAKVIANRYGEAKKKMKYLKNLSNFEEGTEEYKMGQLYNEAYEAGIYNLVFTQTAFDDNLGRLNNLYQDIGNLKALQEAGFTDVANLVDPGKLNREIQMLQTEIEAAETYIDSNAQIWSTEQVQRKKALISAMTNFQKTQDTLIYEYLNNEKIKERKAELVAEDPSLDPNSLELKVIDELIQEYEANQTNPFLEYKSAFTELLKAYAGSPEKAIELEHEIMNKGGIDKMFDALVDTHIIRKSNTKLIQYINLLNDPQGFYEHIEKNFEWMKKLYNKKEQYYKDIVNSELTNIQRNEILNTLAAQGIYVDLEQFAAWVEDHNNVPTYFIDAPKSMIINEDSILYQQYMQIFEDAAQLETELPSSKMSDKEIVDGRVNEVEDERVVKLDQANQRYNIALKKELGYDEKEYMAKLAEFENQQAELNLQKEELDKRKTNLEKSLKQLDSNNHVEVLAVYPTMSDLGYINDALYAAAEEAVLNNPESLAQARAAVAKYDETAPQEERSTAAFYSVILKPLVNDALAEVNSQLETVVPEPIDPKTTKQYTVYQEELKAINDKYDGLVQNLKNEFRKQGIDPDAVTEITVDTSYAQMPQDLKDILDPLFAQHLEFIEVSPTLVNVDPKQYETIRKNWIETQGAVIRKYNADKKAEAAERAKKLAEPPVLQWSPKGEKVLKVTAQTSGAGLTAYYDKLSKILEAGEYVNKKKETVQLTPEDIENIKADLAGLEGYLDARAKTYKPQSIAEEVVDRIIKNVINAQDQVVDVFDESGRKIGRRFADVAEDQPLPVRATKVAEQVDLEITGKDPFLYNRLEDETIQKDFRRVMASEEVKNEDKINVFMTAFEKKNYPAFRTKRKLKLLRAALEAELTEDNLVKTVQRLAYDESTIAGDNVDGLIRDFLTPDAITGFKQITWDPNVMTEEAFNALFHPAYGIVSKLRQGVIDGQYQILSENVKVFDKRLKEAGITGELDLLAIDSDGNVSIIDIKTGKFKNWEAFGTGAKSDKQTYFRAQQSIYKNLFYNMTGIDVQRISLLPIGITTDLDGKILELGLTELTPEGEDTLELEYLPEVEAAGVTKIAPVESVITPIANKSRIDFSIRVSGVGGGNQVDIRVLDSNGKVTREFNIFKKGNIVVIEPIQGSVVKTLDISETEKENLLKEFISQETLDLIYQHRETPSNKDLRSSLENLLSDDVKAFAKTTAPTPTTAASTKDIEAKKADIERRQRVADIITSQLKLGVELPKILETLAEQGYVEKINNSAFFKQSAGRDAVVFNIDGAIVPVYRSSKGTSSKTKGEWYPFFFNGGDWLVKAGADTYKDGYNNPIIKQILDSLNKNYKYDKPLAQVEGNNEELLALLPLGGLDLDVSFEDNSGIYDFQNYIAIAVILKDWQSKLGNIDVSGYQDYLDGASSSLIKTNPTLKSEIEKAFKIPSDIFAELAALGKGVTESKETIQLSDPSKVSLEENLNKPVMYNGRLGKLILLDDGVFGVELDQSSKVTELSLVLEGLKASLEVELGEFGNPTQAAELKNTIAEVQTELDKQAQTKQIIELTRDLMPVKDGKLLLSQAGVFPITNITEVAQVTVINKEQYDAKFDDPSENTATINGVKYTVNRNAQGNIASLSYGVNDKAIADIEAETKELSERINKLKDKRSEIFLRPTAEERTTLTNEINKEQSKINQLNKKRLDLLKSNSKRTVSGGNANNLIFALNKLPNSFQKGHEEKTATDEKKELKQIASLSLASDEANKAMDEILGLNYPNALDTLIEEGISKVNNSDLNTINKWAEDAIANLEELASMMYNKNEIVTEVFNQINALSSLLSDISKINLTKNGKISKRQKPEIKEVFGPERKQVPNRPSVSEVPVPVGGQTEAISRPATGEELSQLREKVKKAKQKGDELIGEILLAESKPVSPIVEEINSTKDQAKLQEVYDKAIIQEAKKPGTVDLNAVKEAFDTRQRELATVMDIGNITVNEPVISKKDIDEALAGSTFLVSSFKGNKVYVANLKTGKGQWYNNSELADNFKKAPVEGIEMEEEIELTPDDITNAEISAANLSEIAGDDELLNQSKEEAKETSEEDLIDQLLNNSNLC